MNARCNCGQPAIGVVIRSGKPALVCQGCYLAECIAAAGGAK